jgi:sugar lactone lactonase YvrE
VSRTEPRAATPRPATEEAFDLAEGPVWDERRQRLLWVDIRRGEVLVGLLGDDGTIAVEERVPTPGTVGALAVSAAGEWILAGQEGILVRGPDGVLRPGPTILPPGTGRRLNDGKPDPAGRFLVGTLMIDESPTETEQLVAVEADGTVREVDGDLTLSNGLGWSPDGRTLYSIDTVRRVVNARDYDPVTGATGPRRVLLTTEDGRFPDGMCVDAEGCLWIAIWEGGQVRRYSPQGELLQAIDVPAPHPSCVAFAGPGLATLVITTATKGLDAERLAASPLSGRLFTVDAGVRGLPVAPWAGFSAGVAGAASA